jgi:hypothetical protein
MSMTSKRYIIYCAKRWPSRAGSATPGARTLGTGADDVPAVRAGFERNLGNELVAEERWRTVRAGSVVLHHVAVNR